MAIEQITEKIRADSAASIEAMRKQMREDASVRAREISDTARDTAAAQIAMAREQAAALEKRALFDASLEARKRTLAARRGLLEEAFHTALTLLCSCDDARYAELLSGMVCGSGALGTEQVLLPVGGRERFERLNMLEQLNRALEKSGRAGSLTLAGEDPSVTTGLLLRGDEFEIPCTLELLIGAYREEHEPETAALLFEGGVQ